METIRIAGVDEAGRGPLAGPVVAAAVILDESNPIEGLMDSKKLSEKRRERLFIEIQEKAYAYGVGRAEVEEIDAINILEATMLAMRRAVQDLTKAPQKILVDGNKAPDFGIPAIAIIKGDQTEAAISAASILAKVTRDREMLNWHEHYPEYGFAGHKGYGTKIHIEALRQYGPTPIHRRTFRPVTELL